MVGDRARHHDCLGERVCTGQERAQREGHVVFERAAAFARADQHRRVHQASARRVLAVADVDVARRVDRDLERDGVGRAVLVDVRPRDHGAVRQRLEVDAATAWCRGVVVAPKRAEARRAVAQVCVTGRGVAAGDARRAEPEVAVRADADRRIAGTVEREGERERQALDGGVVGKGELRAHVAVEAQLRREQRSEDRGREERGRNGTHGWIRGWRGTAAPKPSRVVRRARCRACAGLVLRAKNPIPPTRAAAHRALRRMLRRWSWAAGHVVAWRNGRMQMQRGAERLRAPRLAVADASPVRGRSSSVRRSTCASRARSRQRHRSRLAT